MTLLENKVITKDDLDLYLENLPPKAQLRFASKTSSSGEYGVCTILWDEISDFVGLIPYVHVKKAYKKPHRSQNETPQVLARICLLSELGPDTNDDPQQIGNIFFGNDSDVYSLNDKTFPKYTMLVRSFKGVLRSSEEIISEKNLEPVWVKRGLLEYIFEEIFISEEGKKFGHPQLYAYERFVEFYNQSVRW